MEYFRGIGNHNVITLEKMVIERNARIQELESQLTQVRAQLSEAVEVIKNAIAIEREHHFDPGATHLAIFDWACDAKDFLRKMSGKGEL